MENCIYLKIADVPFALELRDPKIERFYKSFIQPPVNDAVIIKVDDDMIASYPDISERAAEKFWHCALAGDELIMRGKMVFHGCAFLWKESAFIFAAPSGTGKTTQFTLWKKLFREEISILNGDKPVLDFSEDGVFVRPSPWRGKEGIYSLNSAPLKGIIYLCQSAENRIENLEPNKAAQIMYEQVIFSAQNEETALAAAKLTEKLLYSVKLWQFDNRGDEASAILCHDRLEEEL